jgi:hypothetical protein
MSERRRDDEHDEHDELWHELRALPRHDVTPLTAARVRSRAHAALARHARGEEPRANLSRWYDPALWGLRRAYAPAEPLLVAAVCVLYLAWAFSNAALVLTG